MQKPNYGPDPTSPHTTFVQADPSNFRSIVQKLTGASDDPSGPPKLPLTLPSSSRASSDIRRPPFKLHERRHRKLDQIQLTKSNRMIAAAYHLSSNSPTSYYLPSSSTSPSNFGGGRRGYGSGSGSGSEMTVMVSPVSPLDLFTRPGQPSLLLSPLEQEEKAIAEKGFYLHPSPRSTPRGPDPELLPLFPLHSPRDHRDPSES